MPHALVSTTGILEMPDCFPKTPIGLAPSRLTVRDRGQQLLLRHLEEVMTTDLELSEAVVKNVFEGGTIYSADEAVASRFVDTILSPHQNVHQQEATHKLCRAKNPIVIM